MQDQSYELIIHGLESSTSTADMKGYFEQYGDVSVAEVSLLVCVCMCLHVSISMYCLAPTLRYVHVLGCRKPLARAG